ncbi:LAO/AO transport system kinase [Azospirillaceae bacterium]
MEQGNAGAGAELQALRAALAAGGKAALARALARLERDGDAPAVLALLDAAWESPRAEVIGLTGPPGVGKSTLTGALIAGFRRQGRTVAVIAVDPSSRRSGGALLGDRVRLATDPEDGGLFVRSMAARDRLGGLAGLTVSAMVLMRALYDVVLIETVGVGQSETDVATAADTVVFCVQPGSGDSLQFMKAGIVEIPHIVVVTKADMGAVAQRACADMAQAMTLAGDPEGEGWPVPVLALSAQRGEGLEPLLAALAGRADFLAADGRRERLRRRQAGVWLEDAVRERFGRHGLRGAGPLTLPPGTPPFGRLARLLETLGGVGEPGGGNWR